MTSPLNSPGLIVPCLILLFGLHAPLEAVGQTDARRALNDFEHEPSAREVQQAALKATGLTNAPKHRWASRARLAHILPEVRGEVAWLDQRDIEISYREDIEADGSDLVTDSRNDYVDDARLRGVYAIRLEWDLSGLVFDPEELDAAKAAERRHIARAELLQMVTDIYYERRRWQVELALTPKTHVRPRIEAQLNIDRATAKLDAFTGGWFSKALAQSKPRRTRGGRR